MIDPDDAPLSKEHLEQVLRSNGFRLIVERLQEMLKQSTRSLIRASTWEEAARCQGYIQALESFMNVPDMLLEELAPKKREPRR